jgi:hypothetical protein
MWVNNETGLIQPIEEIGAMCREHGVRFHTDATQAVGKLPIDGRRDLPIDLLTFSAHKFHGPKGIGGLYVREGIRIEKQQIGGPQEREKRGGTENVPGIMGMGEAARLARQWLDDPENAAQRQAALRDRFEKAILDGVPDASVNSIEWPRLWTTSNIAFAGLEAEPILLMLSERGVCARPARRVLQDRSKHRPSSPRSASPMNAPPVPCASASRARRRMMRLIARLRSSRRNRTAARDNRRSMITEHRVTARCRATGLLPSQANACRPYMSETMTA